MAFPQTPLDVLIELFISGAWTNITADVYRRDGIHITRGRADEGQRVDPGKCTLTLNNRSGKYSPKNPMSPLYGQIGRNTPVRVSVRTGSPYLDVTGNVADFASTPDTAALDITGDLDLRIEAEADWYATGAQVLIGKWEPTGNQKAYMLRLENGSLVLHHSTDGFTGGFFGRTLPALPRRAALRATLDIDNGAGGRTARFYWAKSMAGPWTEFADPVTIAGTTATFASTAPLKVAPNDLAVTVPRYPFAGKAYKAEVRNGIDGTVVANPDFTVQTVGAASFSDGAGRTWSMNGAAAITNRRTRFVGEISAWPPRWDVSGKDVYTPVEAAGILRRLGQGVKPLASTLRRRIPSYSPRAYWPFEEDRDATQAYSPVPLARPATTQGFTFASDDSLPGSSALPSIGATASFVAVMPPSVSTGTWQMELVYYLQTLPASTTTMFEIRSTGTARRVRVRVDTAQVRLEGFDDDDNSLFTNAVVPLQFTGAWNRLQIKAVPSGGNVDYTVRWIIIGGTGYSTTSTIAGSAGRVSQIRSTFGAGLDGLKFGHLAVFASETDTPFNSADQGFAGETAGTRMQRLSAEEAIPLTVYGLVSATEQMGAQRPDTVLNLIEDAADTDHGILYERRETIALQYRDRGSLYNQTPGLALDYAISGHVAPPLEPVDDDQDVSNDVTVTRVGGSSARAVLDAGPLSTQAPPNGVGVYDESTTLNLYNDDQPAQHAGWRLYLGTADEPRYPVLNLDLAAAPSLIDAVVQLESGDRITIANPPAWLPPGPIDLLMQGYSETLGHPNDWDLQLNCTPAGPWNVGHAEDDVYGWADTDGTALATAATSTATTLTVNVTDGPRWTHEADFPVRVGGEVMTVTDVTGAVHDRFTRLATSSWGTADTGETWTLTGGSTSDYSVQGA